MNQFETDLTLSIKVLADGFYDVAKVVRQVAASFGLSVSNIELTAWLSIFTTE